MSNLCKSEQLSIKWPLSPSIYFPRISITSSRMHSAHMSAQGLSCTEILFTFFAVERTFIWVLTRWLNVQYPFFGFSDWEISFRRDDMALFCSRHIKYLFDLIRTFRIRANYHYCFVIILWRRIIMNLRCRSLSFQILLRPLFFFSSEDMLNLDLLLRRRLLKRRSQFTDINLINNYFLSLWWYWCNTSFIRSLIKDLSKCFGSLWRLYFFSRTAFFLYQDKRICIRKHRHADVCSLWSWILRWRMNREKIFWYLYEISFYILRFNFIYIYRLYFRHMILLIRFFLRRIYTFLCELFKWIFDVCQIV